MHSQEKNIKLKRGITNACRNIIHFNLEGGRRTFFSYVLIYIPDCAALFIRTPYSTYCSLSLYFYTVIYLPSRFFECITLS